MVVLMTGTSEKGASASIPFCDTPAGGESPVPRAGPVVTHLMAKQNLWEELGHLQPPYDTLGTNCHEYTCGERTCPKRAGMEPTTTHSPVQPW